MEVFDHFLRIETRHHIKSDLANANWKFRCYSSNEANAFDLIRHSIAFDPVSETIALISQHEEVISRDFDVSPTSNLYYLSIWFSSLYYLSIRWCR